jgi:hypothetical protein
MKFVQKKNRSLSLENLRDGICRTPLRKTENLQLLFLLPGRDLSRLGNGERNSAKPKAERPSEPVRASQRQDEGELKN